MIVFFLLNVLFFAFSVFVDTIISSNSQVCSNWFCCSSCFKDLKLFRSYKHVFLSVKSTKDLAVVPSLLKITCSVIFPVLFSSKASWLLDCDRSKLAQNWQLAVKFTQKLTRRIATEPISAFVCNIQPTICCGRKMNCWLHSITASASTFLNALTATQVLLLWRTELLFSLKLYQFTRGKERSEYNRFISIQTVSIVNSTLFPSKYEEMKAYDARASDFSLHLTNLDRSTTYSTTT